MEPEATSLGSGDVRGDRGGEGEREGSTFVGKRVRVLDAACHGQTCG